MDAQQTDLLMYSDTVKYFCHWLLWMPQQMDLLLHTNIANITDIVICYHIVAICVNFCKYVFIASQMVNRLRLFLSKSLEEGSFLFLCSPVFQTSLVEEGGTYKHIRHK